MEWLIFLNNKINKHRKYLNFHNKAKKINHNRMNPKNSINLNNVLVTLNIKSKNLFWLLIKKNYNKRSKLSNFSNRKKQLKIVSSNRKSLFLKNLLVIFQINLRKTIKKKIKK